MSLLKENENQFVENKNTLAQDISNSTFKNITDIELIEGVRNSNYLPAKTMKNNKDLYSIYDEVLDELSIPHTKYKDNLIVDKKDKELAEKVVKNVSSKSDAELDSFEKDKAAFINKIIAEIKQYEYDVDVINSEIRSSNSTDFSIPNKPLTTPSNYPKENFDSKNTVDIKEKTQNHNYNFGAYDAEVAEFAPRENVDAEQSETIDERERIYEEKYRENTPSLMDIYNAAAYGVDDDGNIASPDYEEKSLDNNTYTD